MDKGIINCDLPNEINEFTITYDGGRFSFTINGVTYANNCIGNDFNLELNNEGKLELTIYE